MSSWVVDCWNRVGDADGVVPFSFGTRDGICNWMPSRVFGMPLASSVCSLIEGIPDQISRLDVYRIAATFGPVVAIHIQMENKLYTLEEMINKQHACAEDESIGREAARCGIKGKCKASGEIESYERWLRKSYPHDFIGLLGTGIVQFQRAEDNAAAQMYSNYRTTKNHDKRVRTIIFSPYDKEVVLPCNHCTVAIGHLGLVCMQIPRCSTTRLATGTSCRGSSKEPWKPFPRSPSNPRARVVALKGLVPPRMVMDIGGTSFMHSHRGYFQLLRHWEFR